MPALNNYNAYYPSPNLQTMMQQTQYQNSGLISVRNETEARNYPIAPGNSIMFKDESQPYVYVKSMGFSPFDSPTFEKFRLVKEESELQASDPTQAVTRSEFDALREELRAFMNSMKEGGEE